MSEPAPKLLFHIGVEKTGTTSFQRFCFERRAELLQHGLLYPTNSPAFAKKTRNHAPLVAAYLHGHVAPDYTLSKVWRRREDVLGALVQEIDRSADAKTVLISAEHFSSRFTAPQAQRLRADFERFRPRVVIVLRSHLERLYSQYATSVTNGGDLKYDALVEALLAANDASIAYRKLVEIWVEAFGRENVDVLHVPEGGDSVEVLAGAGVIPLTKGKYARPYRDNVGERALVVEVLRQINGLVVAQPRVETHSYFQHWLMGLARSRLLRRVNAVSERSDAAARRVRCTDPQLQSALERAIASDESWLRQNCAVDLRSSASTADEAPTTADVENQAERVFGALDVAGNAWFKLALRAQGRSSAAPAEDRIRVMARGK